MASRATLERARNAFLALPEVNRAIAEKIAGDVERRYDLQRVPDDGELVLLLFLRELYRDTWGDGRVGDWDADIDLKHGFTVWDYEKGPRVGRRAG